MEAPSRIFALFDRYGIGSAIFAATREELNDYIEGTSDEKVFEFVLKGEHPINMDLQQDPEEI